MDLLRNAERLPWLWGIKPDAAWMQRIGVAVPPGSRLAIRAVETHANAQELFRWLCQLRRAPYSYDWIDNFGRRSPKVPDDSLVGMLAVGQTMMTIFTLTDYQRPTSMSMRMKSGLPRWLFGEIRLDYEIEPAANGKHVLRAIMFMAPTTNPLGRLRRYLLAWGDVVMMRKQLHTLRALAEQTKVPVHAAL